MVFGGTRRVHEVPEIVGSLCAQADGEVEASQQGFLDSFVPLSPLGVEPVLEASFPSMASDWFRRWPATLRPMGPRARWWETGGQGVFTGGEARGGRPSSSSPRPFGDHRPLIGQKQSGKCMCLGGHWSLRCDRAWPPPALTGSLGVSCDTAHTLFLEEFSLHFLYFCSRCI